MHKFLKPIALLLVIFLWQSFEWTTPKSQEIPPIILILDGSGSMWGQIEGKTKIEIAREVVGDMVDKMDVTRPLGLVAYGHRQKGDCEDIEELIPVGIGNHDEINSALAAVNPTGKTPLANTAIKVIEQLKASGESATIILVSDGAESCGGDLCEVIRKAKEAGIDFVLHIVGFDIGESDKAALECAAREGEGVYLDASNADELSAALEQTTELTVETPVTTFAVQVTKDGKLHDAAIKVYVEGEQKEIASSRSYYSKESNPAKFSLPPGTYNVEATPLGTDVDAMWKRNIVIKESEMDTAFFDFTAGKASILATSNGELWDCVVSIYKTGQTSGRSSGGRTYTSENHNPMIKELTPGIYDVYVTALNINGADTEKLFEKIEVLPGEQTEITIDYPRGELSILATNNGELWDCVINVTKPGSPKSVGGGRTYNSAKHNPKKQIFAPGTYIVEYSAGKLNGEKTTHTVENVVIIQGETTDVSHNFLSGKLSLTVTHGGEPCDAMINITQPPSTRSVAGGRTYTSTKPKEFIMTPGNYQVEIKPIKVEAATQTLAIGIKAGDVIEKKIVLE